MEQYGIIYMHTNKLNGKSYIGQTIYTLEKRFKEHVCESENKKHKAYNTHFHNALRKYGVENFESKILDVAFSKEGLNAKEQFWILWYGTFGNGYNHNIGGGSGRCSKEAREKLSKSLQGNKYRLGTKMPEYQKEQLKEKMKGNKYRLGKKHSEETKQKISNNNPYKGKFGAEHNRSKGIKAFKYSKDGNHEFIGIFGSISEFKRFAKDVFDVNLETTNISKVCKGNARKTKGFYFEYAN